MPYAIKKRGNKFNVYKKSGSKTVGPALGKNLTRTRALRQLRALYANVKELYKKHDPANFSEAATLKAKVQRLIRDAEDILDDRDVPQHVRDSVTIIRNEMKRTWADLKDFSGARESGMPEIIAEVVKTVGGETFPASDFLVIEDPQEPSKWHLQVKKHGAVDRRLMGAAKAALTAPGGHRGNKYEGPKKTEAIGKLKSLYKSEDMIWEAEVAEDYPAYPEAPHIEWTPTWGATSFEDLDAAQGAKDAAAEVQNRIQQLNQLFSNILADETVEDKPTALRKVTDEFINLVTDIFANQNVEAEIAEVPKLKEDEQELKENADENHDTIAGHALRVAETGDVATGGKNPLILNVIPIRPGWGNKRDNYFYPTEVLKRDAPQVFQNIKMYETDHRENEKSNRTWVSTILETKHLTTDGAPVSRVGVHDPYFAQKVLNLDRLGLLNLLECSILGGGKVKEDKFERDGRTGKIVESLGTMLSVDWVTRAGAGGHALNIAESQGGKMPEQNQVTEASVELQTKARKLMARGPKSKAIMEGRDMVKMSDADLRAMIDKMGAMEESEMPAAPAPETKLVFLGEAEIKAELDKSKLPDAAKDWVSEKQYKDAEELKQSISVATERVKKLTGSGQPFGLGQAKTVAQISEAERIKQHNAALDEIDKRHGLGG